MKELGQHVVAAIGWEREHGWAGTREAIDVALAAGVGGFQLRGGPRHEVAQLTRALHAHSPVTLLLGADLERGAGERFAGAVPLPPAGALASLADAEDAVRRAARITARDARDLGINWAFGPVCDLDFNNGNPIVGARSLGADPARVASLAADWIDACQAESVLACAKHFPGHGRTSDDLVPFRAAIDSGVASIMMAAASSVRLLRDELGYTGLVVSNALGLRSATNANDEGPAAVAALAAGCDLLLAPRDPALVVRAIADAIADGRLDGDQLAESRARRDWWATWGRWQADGRGPTLDDRTWAKQASDRVLQSVRGRVPWLPPSCEVVIVDDDASGDASGAADGASSDRAFVPTLESLGREVRVVPGATAAGEGVLVIAVFADVRAGKGHAGISQASRLTVRLAVQAARALKRDSLVVLFGHSRLAAELPDAAHLLCAWCGDRGMQEAAARALVT
jgi:hypothetical protein